MISEFHSAIIEHCADPRLWGGADWWRQPSESGLTLYDFGNPTAEEQLYLEMINRARADPVAEGLRLATTTDPDVLTAYQYFGVNLTLLQNEFNALPAQPPLAPNACLTPAARSHSAWMLANGIQSHNETNPVNDPFSRMAAAGLLDRDAGENIYASAKSVWFGHVGFEVDWGPGGTGGMLEGRGHRANIHSARYREIGAGVALGSHGSTGPQLITQDFGTSTSSPTLATGVAYYDLNSNNFYDVGEGISGLIVNVSGADVDPILHHGDRWRMGRAGARHRRHPRGHFFRIEYGPDRQSDHSGSQECQGGSETRLCSARHHQCRQRGRGSPAHADLQPGGGRDRLPVEPLDRHAAAVETCETTANITASTTGSYSVLTTNVRQQGSAAFHLENTTAASQWLQLNQLYYGQAAPSLSFQSRIRYATTSERFKVQIKEEGSLAWQDVFSQTGSGGSGESAFNLRTADLPPWPARPSASASC